MFPQWWRDTVFAKDCGAGPREAELLEEPTRSQGQLQDPEAWEVGNLKSTHPLLRKYTGETCSSTVKTLSSGVRLSGNLLDLPLVHHVILLKLFNLLVPLFLHVSNSVC